MFRRRQRTALLTAALTLAAAMFYGDLQWPLGVAGGVPYVAVVLLGWWLPGRRYILFFALATSLLTLAGYFLSPPGGIPWVVVLNRLFALFAVSVTAMALFYAKGEAQARRRSEFLIHGLLDSEKHAETEAREKDERLQAVIDAVPAFVNVKDTDGRYLVANRYYKDVMGIDPEEMIGKTSSIMSRDHGDRVLSLDKAVVETGEAMPFYDYHLVDAEGRDRDMAASKVPLKNLEGEIIGIVSISFDITERKRAEEAVRESEVRLKAIIDAIPSKINVKDTERRFLMTNPAHQKFFGYDPGKLIGGRRGVVHGKDREMIEEVDERVLKTGKTVTLEVLRRNVTGEERVLITTKVPLKNASGEITGIVTSSIDITERKQAEEAVRESEERFRDLAETASDWFWEMDADLRFTFVSEKYYQITGREPKDLIGRTRRETADPEGLDVEPAAWKEHLKTLDAHRPFSDFIMSNPGGKGSLYEGRRYHIMLNGLPRFGQDGEFLGYRGTATDITLRIEAEQAIVKARDELEERVLERTRELTEEVEERKRIEGDLLLAKETAEFSDRAKSEFLANMSHELRTPLNSIIGFSEMLRNETLGPVGNPKYLEYLDDINASGRHLLELIKDILDVSKIEAGAMDMTNEPVDIAACVETSVKMINERARAAQVSVEIELSRDIPFLLGDSLRIRQILLNLIGNAVKFSKPEGRVVVRAGTEAGAVFLEIEDDGIGIAEKDLDRVLEPFTQAANSLTGGYEGAGLGLSLVKSMTELHGGVLVIESEFGKGTTVTVRFPAERTIAISAA